jgi:hypothetical protein
MAEDRVSVPKGRALASTQGTKPDVDNARLLQALQTMDANAGDRLKDLKIFLFVLPLIWGVVWGVVYFLFLLLRTS